MNPSEPNPFQSPQSIDSNSQLDEQVVLRKLQAAQQRRRSWATRCWMLGTALVGFAVFLVAAADKIVASSAVVVPTRWAVVLCSGLALTSFLSGIIIVVLGPISWYWFGQGRERNSQT